MGVDQKTNDQVTLAETTEILRCAESCLSILGDFVELGCYRGDTSVLLGKMLQRFAAKNLKTAISPMGCENTVENSCKTLKQFVENLGKTHQKLSKTLCKNLWIYDSFAGLPEKTTEDSSGAGKNFQKGELFVSKREVIEKLRKHGLKTANRLSLEANPDLVTSTVIVKKSWFDELQSNDLPEKIAFAFLDGDLYDSIKISLKLVVPRLSEQGIIIVHDYNNPELPGSARAVDDFLRDHSSYQLAQKYTLAIITRKC